MLGFWRSSSSVVAAVAAGMLAITATSWIPAQGAEPDEGSKPKEIKARSFVIRDLKGRARACLQFTPGDTAVSKYSSPALQLLGTDGQVRFDFGFDDQRDAPVLQVFRADGQPALFLSSDKNGNVVAFEPRGKKPPAILIQTQHCPDEGGDRSAFTFFTPDGKPEVSLAVSPDDSPGMRLCDAEGRPYELDQVPAPPTVKPIAPLLRAPVHSPVQAEKGAGSDSPVLTADQYLLLNDQNRVRATFGLTEDDDDELNGAALEFYDVKGTPRAKMSFDEDQNCSTVILGDVKGDTALSLHVSSDGPLLKLFSSQEGKSILLSLSKPSQGRLAGAGAVNLTGSDGLPRVIFGESSRGGGLLGAQDRTGKTVLMQVH